MERIEQEQVNSLTELGSLVAVQFYKPDSLAKLSECNRPETDGTQSSQTDRSPPDVPPRSSQDVDYWHVQVQKNRRVAKAFAAATWPDASLFLYLLPLLVIIIDSTSSSNPIYTDPLWSRVFGSVFQDFDTTSIFA